MRGIYQTKDVVGLLARPHKRFKGLSRNEIADALRISRQAVSRHLGNASSRGGANGAKNGTASKAEGRKVGKRGS